MKYLITYESHNKFKSGDFAKRKKDGAISQIIRVDWIRIGERYDKNNIYIIDFGDGEKRYMAKQLDKPKPSEIKLYKDTQKYNL